MMADFERLDTLFLFDAPVAGCKGVSEDPHQRTSKEWRRLQITDADWSICLGRYGCFLWECFVCSNANEARRQQSKSRGLSCVCMKLAYLDIQSCMIRCVIWWIVAVTWRKCSVMMIRGQTPESSRKLCDVQDWWGNVEVHKQRRMCHYGFVAPFPLAVLKQEGADSPDDGTPKSTGLFAL